MSPRPLSILLLLAAGCGTATAPPPDERFDDPDAAAHYRALKQSGTDDPFRELSRARQSMRSMAKYSTQDDRWSVASSSPSEESAGLLQELPPLGKWRFLGPGNIGGRTRVLVIDRSSPRIMYTAGVSGGLWKTYTAGLEWEPIGDDLANIAVNSLVMHPTDPKTLYAGTGEGYFREEIRGTALPLRGDGIFVTHDGGESWLRLPSTANPDFHFVNDLAISSSDPSRIYAATRTGVWRSIDAGTTWSRVLDPAATGGCLDLAQRAGQPGDYLFASCGTFAQATVWRSKSAEGNGSWEAVLSEPNMGRTSLAIAPSDPSIVYALAATNEPGLRNQALLGVYRSKDDGDAGSWQTRSNASTGPIEAQMLSNLLTGFGRECLGQDDQFVTMGWYCNTIAVDPVDADRVWAGGVDLLRSDDGGLSWGVASYWWATSGNHPSFAHADQHAIVFDPRYDGSSVRTVYFTNDGGVFRTDDALAQTARGPRAPCDPVNSKLQFVDLNNSYGVTQFYHGAVSPDGKQLVAGAQDNGTLFADLVDGPNRWRTILGGDGAYVAFAPDDSKWVFAESQWGNMARSNNGGFRFNRINRGLDVNPVEEFLFITPFVIDANFPRRLWLGGRSMWVTEERGDRWARGSAPLPGLVSSMAVQPGNSDLVIAGLATGPIARTDHGTTATASTQWSVVQPRTGFVSSIAFDPKDPRVVYATYAGFGGDHVWISTDAGLTWSSRSGNLPDLPVHSVVVDPTRENRLYLGTDLGVFVTLDGGQTWAVENTGFANAVTESLVIAPGANGPALYAFTHGRGAWRAELVLAGPRTRAVRR